MKIAIDGPAGAGKSTISKAVAESLGYVYIDTGAMYRSVGLAVLDRGLKPAREEDVLSILDEIEIDIKTDGGAQRYYLNGEDVTERIRENPVSMAASHVAVIPAVRLKLVDLQRKMAEKADVIMDGRDIGTYVLPDAELKIYLTATVRERALRRYRELASKGETADMAKIEEEIIARDKNDSERKFAPLRQAEDAVLVDTTHMSPEEVIRLIRDLAEGKRGEAAPNDPL